MSLFKNLVRKLKTKVFRRKGGSEWHRDCPCCSQQNYGIVRVVVLVLLAVLVFNMLTPMFTTKDRAEAILGAGDTVVVINWPQWTAVQEAFSKLHNLLQWVKWITQTIKHWYMEANFLINNPLEYFQIYLWGEPFELYNEVISLYREIQEFAKGGIDFKPGGKITIRIGAFASYEDSEWKAVADSGSDYMMPSSEYMLSGDSIDEQRYKKSLKNNAIFVSGPPPGLQDKLFKTEKFQSLPDDEREYYYEKAKQLDNAKQALSQRVLTGGRAVVVASKMKDLMKDFDLKKIDSGSFHQSVKDLAKLMYINNMLTAELLMIYGETQIQEANYRSLELDRWQNELVGELVRQ